MVRSQSARLAGDLTAQSVSYDSQAIMSQIDGLPPEWRQLVYEYGFQIVKSLRQNRVAIDQAAIALANWRASRQP
jgi:hypothetical protein